MALAAPTVDFPDMTALVQQNQGRATSLMNAAWAQLADLKQSRDVATQEQAAQAAAEQRTQFNPAQTGNYARDMSIWNQQPGANPSGSTRPGQPLSATPDDRLLLAQTLQAEAGGEGYEGMLAAGAVINNRVRTGGYGEGLRGVIMKPGQFSAWNGVTGYANGEGAIDMSRITPNEHALRAADALIAGQYQDPTGGATHYYNPAVATPKWGQQAGGNWTKIGNHVFGFADAGRQQARPQPQAQPIPQSARDSIMMQARPQALAPAMQSWGASPYVLGQPA